MEISATAEENSETGLDFGLQCDLWSQGRYALVVEGRYSWALTKNTRSLPTNTVSC